VTQKLEDPHGVLVVDKPSGATSHDIVARARRIFRTQRVGHAGTLDPLATGVLVLLFGEATKLSEVATLTRKSYRAEVCFGRSTDSHDADGATTEEASLGWQPFDGAALESALAAERARVLQVPPVVSAIKLHGHRAHALSRRGTPPDLAARPVRVESLTLVASEAHTLTLELTVSKGYYVRALARDLSHALGIPAHLSGLRRLVSGDFTLAEACTWPPVPPVSLLPLRALLPRLLPVVRLSSLGVQRARRGQLLQHDDFLEDPEQVSTPPGGVHPTTVWAWTNSDGLPIALGRRDADGFRVRRGFMAEEKLQEPPLEQCICEDISTG
jgi:tRNA pseudouridine55 synthase